MRARPDFHSGIAICRRSLGARDIAKRLVGTWRLVSLVNDRGKPARGPHPTGYIHYDPSGIMSVQIQPDWERPKVSFGKSTPEQAKAALEGYTAYFGTYFVDKAAAIVTHRRAGNINPGDMGDFSVRSNSAITLILRSETGNTITWASTWPPHANVIDHAFLMGLDEIVSKRTMHPIGAGHPRCG